MIFADRRDAGTELAKALARQEAAPDLVVGLARGGLIVAERVAARFGAPLGVAAVSVMRAPAPTSERVGAAAGDGTLWVDRRLAGAAGLDDAILAQEARAARARARWAQRRIGPAGRISMNGLDVLLVDEGLCWAGRAAAAARWARRHGAARIVLAVPMATPDAVEQISHEVDCVVTLRLAATLTSHEHVYRRFDRVELADVLTIAREHLVPRRASHPASVRATQWRRATAIAS